MKKQILSTAFILMMCLSFVSVSAVTAQAAGSVKLGKYSNDFVKNEFIWHIILKADNTFELRTGDYEGIYYDTGTWAIDSSGNITANIVDIGMVTITVGDGVLTLWGAPLYYNEPATAATPAEPSVTTPSAPASATTPAAPAIQSPTILPADSTTDETAINVNVFFEKTFTQNDFLTIYLGIEKPLEVDKTFTVSLGAAKVDLKKAVFYAYNKEENKYKLMTAHDPKIDGANLTLNAGTFGTYVVISLNGAIIPQPK